MDNNLPPELQKIKQIIEQMHPKKLAAAGASNLQICSKRSVRFDLPDGKAKDGINRIKITNMGDGALRVQLLKVEEVDLIGGVLPENLSNVLSQFTGVEV